MPISPRSTRCAPTSPPVDQIWVLGDTVGYGPRPNEVIAALQEIGARSVLGNHDGAAIGTVDPGDFNPDAHAAINWTAGALDDNARAYLAALPEVRRDGDLTAVHGSPRDPIWEYIVSTARGRGESRRVRHPVVPLRPHALPGRLPRRRRRRRGRRWRRWQRGRPRAPRAHQPRQRGQPRDGNPAASYLVLDTDAGRAAYRRVPYDVDATQRQMVELGLPPRLAERLSYGR